MQFSHRGQGRWGQCVGRCWAINRLLERGGSGLNLTQQVRDGILNHTGCVKPMTLEGCVVKICDRIAYLCHDYDDAVRAGMLNAACLPAIVRECLGSIPSDMITAMVSDLINNSLNKSEIIMSDTVAQAMHDFRTFMFESVYESSSLEADRRKARYVVQHLYEHYAAHASLLPVDYQERIVEDGLKRVLVDYIAGLTDLYALRKFGQYFVPAIYPDYI